MRIGKEHRDLGIVILFACLANAVFLNQAYHIDEPCFLAIAKHILRDPLHPLNFRFNWSGQSLPMGQINPNPTLVPYLLACALRLTGAREWITRLVFIPFDCLAAAALYLLAARFLSMPLLPTLIVLAGPAYWINMQHLMAEKWMGAFGFTGIYVLVKSLQEGKRPWFWFSAVLLGLAMTAKYSAVFLLPPALLWAWQKRAPPRSIALHLFIAVSPPLCRLLWDLGLEPGRIASVWRHLASGTVYPRLGWVHQMRSFLSFAGGCGVVTAVWPYLECRNPRRQDVILLTACIAAALLLFVPGFDLDPVRGIDRITGILFSSGALLALANIFRPRNIRSAGCSLWAPWILAVAVLQLFVYWSVVSRFILFAMPPMVFAAAAALELRENTSRLRRIYLVSLAGTAALSLGLGLVDYSYASAQRGLAQTIAERYLAQGRRVWFTGHWGLQYYLEERGALGLDQAQGGWDAVKSGDIVVVPSVNALILKPAPAPPSRAYQIQVDHFIPLRLISAWTGQGAFYTNASGCFLPYSVSREPVERFTVIQKL